MLVKDYMTRHPIMIGPDMRVTEAQKLMAENNIRHLPVAADGKRLLGLVTRQRLSIPPERLGSLDVWEITRFLSDLTVSKVMVKGPDLRTITPEATVEEAASLMIRHKIGSLPVIEDGQVVIGIITEIDLLIELQNLLGANDEGWRVTMRVPDRIGEFSKLTKAMLDNGWGIMAMGSVRAPKQPDLWDVVLKVRRPTREELVAVLEAIPDQKLIDIRETTEHTDASDRG
ncbi:MAG: CBS domain-containing protein [Anaerolineae bacterium]|nr:CBS domain-containing protein [Anaerolineae bacterium]